MKYFIVIIALAVLVAFLSCGDEGFVDIAPLDELEDAPDILTGYAVLKDAENESLEKHDSIRVELVDIELSLLTNEDGMYNLPENMAEGDWNLEASYPFFSAASQGFTVQNGVPTEELAPMELYQQVAFGVATDKQNYELYKNEIVKISLVAQNLTEEPITLSSPTSPQATYAVRKDGVTVVERLLPGMGEEPQSVTLKPCTPGKPGEPCEPGEPYETTLTWTIDNTKLEPGEYEVFAVLTDGANYPDYFSTEEGLMEQFNESLYSKLEPYIITIHSD